MKNPSILTSAGQINNLARKLAEQEALAIDLEADSLHRYRDKICLMQISTRNETFLIDTLLVDQLEPLRPVLADPDVRKIFHAADYDLRCLRRDFDLQVHGLFDTMVSAQLLGEERIGLADLLHKYFGVKLDKRFQKADWSQRPLPSEMIEYAAEDTSHLHRLVDIYESRLTELGRLTWAKEEFLMLEKVRFDPLTGPLCLRIKGAGKLDSGQLSVLEELLHWREGEGRRRDQPVFKVISNQSLLELAKHSPQTPQDLKAIEGLSSRLIDKLGRSLLKAIRRGLDLPESERPAFSRSVRAVKPPQMEKNLKALKGWRQKKAKILGLDPGVLISNSILEQLAIKQPGLLSELKEIEGLKGWQYQEFGEEILHELATAPK